MKLQNTVAIVTGAGRGIGRATAIELAAEGARVMVVDLDEGEAAQVAKEIEATGGTAIASATDVTDQGAVQSMAATAEQQLGDLTILVNNAGIVVPAMAHKMSLDQWSKSLDVNLTGAFNCIQAVGPSFMRQASERPDDRAIGRIVNVTSVAGLRGTIGQVNYGAAKAGLIGLTMSIAREWGRYRVTCNAVAFGAVETRLTEAVRTDQRFRDHYLDQMLIRRYATPEEAARTILFLASPDADYITGHTLNVSGGIHVGF